MSKKRDFDRLAKRVGIIRPDVTYHRLSKSYVISIAEVKMTGKRGYTSIEVGSYRTIEDAQGQLQDDIQACVDRNLADYPDILERVTSAYHIVTSELSDRDRTHQLLESLLDSQKTKELAQVALDYIQSLESKIEADTVHPSGKYTSQYPDVKKKPIDWTQPDYREHPVYIFEVDCPYCGQHVTLERHSSKEPVHCGKDDCATEHNRTLARERKRRQRERAKAK
jgi:hypothetical protein